MPSTSLKQLVFEEDTVKSLTLGVTRGRNIAEWSEGHALTIQATI